MHALLTMGVILPLATSVAGEIHQQEDCLRNVSWNLMEHDFFAMAATDGLNSVSMEQHGTFRLDAISTAMDLSNDCTQIIGITDLFTTYPTQHIADLMAPNLSKVICIETIRPNPELTLRESRRSQYIAEHLNGVISSGMFVSDGNRANSNPTTATLATMVLAGAIAAGTIRRGMNMRGADLADADLTGANLCFEDLSKANLTDATLFEADLTGANLSEANLSGTNLNRAILTGANLSEAVLYGASLTQADLRGADLRKADLRNTNIDSAASLEGAIYDGELLFPRDFDPLAYDMILHVEYTTIESNFLRKQEIHLPEI